MAAVLEVATHTGLSVGAGNTRYHPTMSAGLFQIGVESGAEHTSRAAGTYSNLYVRVSANATTGTSTIRFRKNRANGNQSVSITAGSTGEFEDTTNSDSVVAGDETDAQTVNGGGGALTIVLIGHLFSATTNTYMQAGGAGTLIGPAASTTYYRPIVDTGHLVTAETQQQLKSKSAGTLKNLYWSIDINGRSTTTTLRSRINGANGNLVISVTGSSTGVFEDTSNSDTVAVDDLINLSVTTGTGTGDIDDSVRSIGFETTDGAHEAVCQSSSAPAFGTSVTRFFPVAGRLEDQATENNTKIDANYAPTASKLRCYVSANTVSAASTLRLRINGANGNQVVTITASTTGWFEDSSNTDVLAATDEINYSLVTGGTGTTITLQTIAMRLVAATATTINVPAGSLAVSGLVPFLGLGLQTPAGTLSLSGLAPSLGHGLPVPAGSVALSGLVPSLGFAIGVTAGSLVITGTTPSLGGAVQIDVPAGALTFSGLAPALAFSLNVPAGSVSVAGQAPSLGFGLSVPAGALTVTTTTPSLGFAIAVPAGALTLTGTVPALDGSVTIAVPAGALAMTGTAPSLGFMLATGAGALTVTGLAPSLNTTVGVGVGAMTLTGLAPSLGLMIGVPAGSVTLTGIAPSLGGVAVTPDVIIRVRDDVTTIRVRDDVTTIQITAD